MLILHSARVPQIIKNSREKSCEGGYSIRIFFKNSVFVDPLGRTLDPIFHIVSYGKSIVSHDHLLSRYPISCSWVPSGIRYSSAHKVVQELPSTNDADLDTLAIVAAYV